MARTSEAEKKAAVTMAKVHGFKKTAKEYKVTPVTLYAWARKMNGHAPKVDASDVIRDAPFPFKERYEGNLEADIRAIIQEELKKLQLAAVVTVTTS